MASFTFEFYPDFTAYIFLYHTVKNARALQETSALFNSCLIDPSMVSSVQHLLCGVNKAIYNLKEKRMKTMNLFTEILYCLSPSSSVRRSVEVFGIKDLSSELLVVCFEPSDAEVLESAIAGELAPFETLANYANFEKIRTEFGIKEEELGIDRNMTPAIYSRLAAKDLK